MDIKMTKDGGTKLVSSEATKKLLLAAGWKEVKTSETKK